VISVLTLEDIRDKAKLVAEKYDVVSLELFGSYANGAAGENFEDDELLQASGRIKTDVIVDNPVTWLMEVTRNERKRGNGPS
jgi:predicted nucleotidyltransferase